MAMAEDPRDIAELVICVKCTAGQALDADGRRAGERLYINTAAQDLPGHLGLRAVECLQNCDQGCSVAMRGGPARWTYVYGNLDPDTHGPLLAEGLAAYHAAADGVIPWRARPEHFKRNCIARIPPEEDI